jgi:hypothetical protein
MTDGIELSDSTAPTLNLVRDGGETDPRKLTEDEARAWLATNAGNGKAPSHRDLAAQWGWHRSKVARFLSRVERETKAATKRETPIAVSGPAEFDWYSDEADDVVLIEHQPRTAVYWNPAGHVVIRQEGGAYEDDPYVVIAPEYLRCLIDRLIKCRDKGE